MTTKNAFFPLLLLIVFFFSACEKEDDKTLLFPGKSKLDFGYNDNMLELSLGNISDQSLNWTAIAADDFLVLDQTSGTLEAGAYLSLSISLQRDKIAGDSVQSSITFSSNVGQDIRVGVLIYNYPENKIRLSYKVIDMAFDENSQLLYLRSDSYNNAIEVFDLHKKTFRKIDLDFEFYSSNGFMQMMPDGMNLIIADYQTLYIVDVESEKIVYSHDFNDRVVSAAGTSDQVIYITLNRYNQNFLSLDLTTLGLTYYNMDLEEVYIQVHPSWKYLYGIGHYDDLMKFDIQGNLPQVIYSNYGYQQADRLWISGDGTRIITSDKKFIHIDPDMSGYDVLTTETISVSPYNYILDFAENQQNNEYYLIFNDSYYYDEQTDLYACDQNMNTLRQVVAEPFFENATNGGYESVEALPLQVFSNSADNSLILLTYGKVDYRDVYAIEIIENNDIE